MVEIRKIKYYGIREVAERLDVTPQTVRTYIQKGKLKAKVLSNALLVSKKELDKYIESIN